jgi:hypothetical protein
LWTSRDFGTDSKTMNNPSTPQTLAYHQVYHSRKSLK